jgi:outer membrane protein assembly factor BamB
MARRGWIGWLAVLLVAARCGPARAADLPAVVLCGETKAAAARLAAAQKLLDEKKWPEAVAELQAIVDTAGDALVPLGGERSVAARRLCHARLAALPPEGLRLYRARVEPQARKWLEEAAATRDAALLRKVVDEAFCSRAAETALDRLGDFAFERGRFAEAEGWWRALAPMDGGARKEGGSDGELFYPDPQGAPRALAKQLLARLFRGDAGFERDLETFRARHGKAEGTLGGRKGAYADLLRALAAERKKPPALPREWTTFGGDPQRGLVVPAGADVLERLGGLCRGGPRWRFDLATRQRIPGRPALPGAAVGHPLFARGLAFHPLIAAGQVLVADARRVTAYDLTSGEGRDWYDAAEEFGGFNVNERLPAPADLRYTLTVAGGRVYARLGAQEVRPPAKEGKGAESLLVCLSLRPLPSGKHLLWYAKPDVVGNAVYEGAPLVGGGVVAVAATRFENDRAVTEIIGYPADAESISPAPLWRTAVCETHEPRPGEGRFRHHLLARAGHCLVYCSHSGAIVALDGLTGRRLWSVRYPRRAGTDEGAPPLHDLMPCLFAEGRLYAAPADSDRLLCLDPATGKTLWEREHTDVVHLLGVGRGRLIYTTPDGLWAVGAADGAKVWSLPDTNGRLAPLGRGLLLGDLVLWPTPPTPRHRYGVVYAVRQEDGRQPDGFDPSLLYQVPAGNMVYSAGCLAVTDRRTLSVFVPSAFDLGERARQARAHPDSPGALLALARSEADAGQAERALANAGQAERLALALPAGRGRHFITEARRLRHALLLKGAQGAAAEKRWADAEAALKQAAGPEIPPRPWLLALVRTAELHEEAGNGGAAVAAWQAILSIGALRGLQVQDGDSPAPAGAYAAGRIAALRGKHGDAVYEPFEKQARDLWEGATEKDRPALAERLAGTFPNAAVTRRAWLELARRAEEVNRPSAAAWACRRLLQLGGSKHHEGAALVHLARAYERQGCWAEARAVWVRLDKRFGAEQVPELAPKRSAHDFVTEHLRSPPFTPAAPPPPAFALPLSRSWHVFLAPGEFALPPSNSPQGQTAEALWTVRPRGDRGELVCRDDSAGQPRWACPLPFVPTWLAAHADTVLAAGPLGAACVGAETGRLLWHFAAPTSDRAPRATCGVQVVLDPLPPSPLRAFRLANGRLFLLQGERRLFALDVESGRVLWNRSAPGSAFDLPAPQGRFRPAYSAGPECVVIQAGSGRRWCLEAATGRLLRDEAGDGACPAAPLPLDEHNLALVSGPREVALLDPTTGSRRWTYHLRGSTTLSGEPPRVIGNPRVLLVVIPANVGYFLQRVNLLTGNGSWPRPQLLRLDHADTTGWAIDDTAVYYPRGAFLCARSLDTGDLLWERPLPGSAREWRVFRLRGQLLVYPAAAEAHGFLFQWLFGSLQWRMVVPSGPDGRYDFPVLCCDPQTGQVVQRLNFRPALPPAAVRARTTVEATLLPTLLGTSAPAGPLRPSVFFCRGRLIVALPGVLWAVSGANPPATTVSP